MRTERLRPVAVILLVLALLVSPAVAQTPDATPDLAPAGTIDIPDDAIRVSESGGDYASIEDAIAAAAEGDTIEVAGGTWDGPIVIDKSVRLVGTGNPVIDGHEEGTIVLISAPDVVLQGFTLQNSGSNFDREDSGVYIEAENVQVLDNRLLDVQFGINGAKMHDGVISRNYVRGKDVDMGVRGDGIKVWYSHNVRITHNTVERSRDLLVWYSNFVMVSDNVVRDSRYGFHFMNSDDGVAERNAVYDNSVGIYLMYGRRFEIRDNLLQGSRGPSGHGLGLKEIDGVVVEGNIIHDNRIGVYFDGTPLSAGISNYFRGNMISYNDQGFGMLPSTKNNVFSGNSMVDNLEQVAILGGGQLGENQWSEDGVGNFWSDYAGYDADGNGIGDVPFRSEQLSEQLMDSWPILQLFRFSVAEAAVDFGSRAVPMFKSEPKLTDDYPLVEPMIPANAPKPVGRTGTDATTAWSIVMLVGAAGAIWWGVRGTRYRPQATRPAPTPSPAGAVLKATR